MRTYLTLTPYQLLKIQSALQACGMSALAAEIRQARVEAEGHSLELIGPDGEELDDEELEQD